VAKKADVVVIGGGVMGVASAWKLATAGLDVVVLEKSVPGAEASSAAAGILGAHSEAEGPGPMADLLLAGIRRYPAWARALSRATGIDIGYRRSGVLHLGITRRESTHAISRASWMRQHGRRVRKLDDRAARRLEPALGEVDGGVLFPDDGRVDPKLFFRAVHIAAGKTGVRFESGAYVRRILAEQGRVRGVAMEGGLEYRANRVVLAAGSWSSLVFGTPLEKDSVVPARGQMIELDAGAPLLDRVVIGPRCYIVPRDDGRALVGSTVEFVGYRREVTARAVRDLLRAAIRMVPALGDATLGATWSNFRPYTPDELPILGRTSVDGLFLATGHHRNGILLAPITAEITCALALGKRPPIDVTPFEMSRFDSERRSRRRHRRG
jgi:glycine oxidase